mmetsp:Transcript_30151/g.66853  ORF Transcript_30151/g.66853 Transcript_30151/m.66853 type:complete len:157 (-) Transcript_30151:1812-2282(-)
MQHTCTAGRKPKQLVLPGTYNTTFTQGSSPQVLTQYSEPCHQHLHQPPGRSKPGSIQLVQPPASCHMPKIFILLPPVHMRTWVCGEPGKSGMHLLDPAKFAYFNTKNSTTTTTITLNKASSQDPGKPPLPALHPLHTTVLLSYPLHSFGTREDHLL